ncbi:MAG: lytic transglycosylase domain-containing protein [Halobacteriovoraceae bacterium]|nr:lytic transglycosylase domain-containing protein [Halobacteriovoraceae bacterium]
MRTHYSFYIFTLFLCLISCASKHPATLENDVEMAEEAGRLIIHKYSIALDRISVEDLENTKEKAIKAGIYFPYLSYLESLKEIINASNIGEKTTKCDEQYKKLTAENTFKYLSENLKWKCLKEVKNQFSNITKEQVPLVTSFVAENIEYFVKSIDEKDFLVFLKKYSNTVDKTSIVYHLTQYYLKTETTPPKKLKDYVTISSKLNQLISEHGYGFADESDRAINNLKTYLRKIYPNGGKPNIGKIVKRYYPQIKRLISRNVSHFDSPESIDEIVNLAFFLTRNNFQLMARSTLDFIRNNYTLDIEIENKLHFNYLWSYLTQNQYKKSMQYITNNNLITRFSSLSSQNQYWIGFVLKKTGNHKEASRLVKETVRHNPISFYSALIMKELQEAKGEDFKIVKSFYSSEYEYSDGFSKEFVQKYKNNFHRLNIWNKINANGFLLKEFSIIKNRYFSNLGSEEDLKIAKNNFYYNIAKYFNDIGAYLPSFQIVFNALEENEIQFSYALLSKLFPKPYQDEIKSLNNGLDTIFLYSLIRQESGFNPKAKSAVGATGLMQLMPRTARRFDRKATTETLTQPHVNIKIGVNYLSDLLQRYNNNLIEVLSAYNAGESRVDRWKKSYLIHDSNLFNIESIPFNETRKYVKLIMRNMFFYKFLLGDEEERKPSSI